MSLNGAVIKGDDAAWKYEAEQEIKDLKKQVAALTTAIGLLRKGK